MLGTKFGDHLRKFHVHSVATEINHQHDSNKQNPCSLWVTQPPYNEELAQLVLVLTAFVAALVIFASAIWADSTLPHEFAVRARFVSTWPGRVAPRADNGGMGFNHILEGVGGHPPLIPPPAQHGEEVASDKPNCFRACPVVLSWILDRPSGKSDIAALRTIVPPNTVGRQHSAMLASQMRRRTHSTEFD